MIISVMLGRCGRGAGSVAAPRQAGLSWRAAASQTIHPKTVHDVELHIAQRAASSSGSRGDGRLVPPVGTEKRDPERVGRMDGNDVSGSSGGRGYFAVWPPAIR